VAPERLAEPETEVPASTAPAGTSRTRTVGEARAKGGVALVVTVGDWGTAGMRIEIGVLASVTVGVAVKQLR
jgi:hypothetical protein